MNANGRTKKLSALICVNPRPEMGFSASCYPSSILMMMTMDGNSLQVTLSVGIPTLAVLVSTLINNSRLSDLRSYIDSRFTAMEHVMDARFTAMDAKLLRIEASWTPGSTG